jgi:hypothetical protein
MARKSPPKWVDLARLVVAAVRGMSVEDREAFFGYIAERLEQENEDDESG